MRGRTFRIVVFLLAFAAALPCSVPAQSALYATFEQYLNRLRQQAAIPGLSAAIVRGRQVVWEAAFGFKDVENSILAAPETPYYIADLTEPLAATLLLQCEERGDVELSAPIGNWTTLIPDGRTPLLALATHRADDGGFKFDPSRFAALTPVIASCGEAPFPRALADEILTPLRMVNSAPSRGAAGSALFDQDQRNQYAAVVRNLALPYKPDKKGKPVRSDFPADGVNAATGVISTVRDLALFDRALDDGVLLRGDTRARAWSAGSPSAVGWFVQTYNGERVVWQFGLAPGAYSSLIVKVPGRDLTLILLANSDGLSQPFPLDDGDVTDSLFASVFLRLFVV